MVPVWQSDGGTSPRFPAVQPKPCLFCTMSCSSDAPLNRPAPTRSTALQVYNIEARPQEPVGGAARFMGAAREYAGEQPLVLFSGDCLNPSLMSAFTRGEQVRGRPGWPARRPCALRAVRPSTPGGRSRSVLPGCAAAATYWHDCPA